jgi:hypothetical protein
MCELLRIGMGTSGRIGGLTTWRASLATLVLAANDRHCARESMQAGRKAERNRYGASLDAIVAVRRRNGCLEVRVVVVMIFVN